MLSYEVTIQLEDLSLAEALENYMRDRHLAQVFATGCFLEARFEQSAPGTYRSRYTVASEQDLERYLAQHAALLRSDFADYFPTDLTLTRTIWTEKARPTAS